MRTTVTLDDDVAAAVDNLRRRRSLGLSEAVNELVRAGLRVQPPQEAFQQRTERLGLKLDVMNVADAIEQLEGPSAG